MRQPLALAQQLEGVALFDVDQQHPGAGEHQRPGVRVAAVRGRRRVEHGPHAGRDQLLGRDPVDVEVVDDGDVAGREPLDQVLGAAAEPGDALDRPRPGPRRSAVRAAQGSDGDWRWPRSEVNRSGKRRKARVAQASGGREQLAGVAGRRLVGAAAAEHAADLLDDPLAVEALAPSPSPRSPSTSFSRRKWVAGQRGDLRQVGDADHLAALAERAQPLADDAGGVAADPGVDLVEDQGRRRRPPAPRPQRASITRESSPPEAASRSGAASIPGFGAILSSTDSAPPAPKPSGLGSSTTSSEAPGIASCSSSFATLFSSGAGRLGAGAR